jgi:protein TonB
MPLNPTYPAPAGFKGPFGFSVAFHVLLFVLLAISTVNSHRGDTWGGPGGGSMTIGLVGSAPAIPLPTPPEITSNPVVDESKGLYKSEPVPNIPPPADATPLPKFEKNKPPKYITRPSKVLPNPTPPPENAVPYGGGGTPSMPTSSFAMGSGSTAAGLGVSGPGAGNFGARYSWYVEAVQRRISGNWLQSTVDPNIRWAPRMVVTFQIQRNGSVANSQILQTSGNRSVDNSAIRAIQESSPFQPLPNDYNGSFVNVEFWFEFKR